MRLRCGVVTREALVPNMSVSQLPTHHPPPPALFVSHHSPRIYHNAIGGCGKAEETPRACCVCSTDRAHRAYLGHPRPHINLTATIMGRHAPRALSLLPPPPGNGPAQAVRFYFIQGSPGRIASPSDPRSSQSCPLSPLHHRSWTVFVPVDRSPEVGDPTKLTTRRV